MKRAIQATINGLAAGWDVLKSVYFLPVIVGIAVVTIIASQDNTARPSAEIENEAWTEWQDMDPLAQTMICNIYEEVGNQDDFFEMLITEGGVGQAQARARINIMERECNNV